MRCCQRDWGGGVSARGRSWDPSPSAWSPWLTHGSHSHPTTHTDETGWHRGTIRGTVTFSEELLCLTKTSPRAARANGLIFCKMNLRHLLNYIPDLLSCASEDKVACELPKGGEMPAYFNRVHDPLLALWRPWSPPYMFTSSLIRQSHGQAWIILHREAQRYISITGSPSLKASLIWILHILTLKRMSFGSED